MPNFKSYQLGRSRDQEHSEDVVRLRGPRVLRMLVCNDQCFVNWDTSPTNEQFQSWRVSQSTNPSTSKSYVFIFFYWPYVFIVFPTFCYLAGKFPISLFGGPPGVRSGPTDLRVLVAKKNFRRLLGHVLRSKNRGSHSLIFCVTPRSFNRLFNTNPMEELEIKLNRKIKTD